jgi:hypothetical protein
VKKKATNSVISLQSHLSKIESDKAVVTVPELVKIAGSLEKPIAFFVS